MRRAICFKVLAVIGCALLYIPAALADALDTWLAVSPSPQFNSLYGVTYTNGLFLACGANGAITTSTNGLNWTNRNSGNFSTLRGMAFGSDTYVAVGYAAINRTILTSTNVVKIGRAHV